MTSLDDIRRYALRHPEVAESRHIRQPSFTVRGTPFAGVVKGGTTAVFSVSQQEAAVTAVPGRYRRRRT